MNKTDANTRNYTATHTSVGPVGPTYIQRVEMSVNCKWYNNDTNQVYLTHRSQNSHHCSHSSRPPSFEYNGQNCVPHACKGGRYYRGVPLMYTVDCSALATENCQTAKPQSDCQIWQFSVASALQSTVYM